MIIQIIDSEVERRQLPRVEQRHIIVRSPWSNQDLLQVEAQDQMTWFFSSSSVIFALGSLRGFFLQQMILWSCAVDSTDDTFVLFGLVKGEVVLVEHRDEFVEGHLLHSWILSLFLSDEGLVQDPVDVCLADELLRQVFLRRA